MGARLERGTDLSLVHLVRVAEPCPLAGDGWEKGPRARFCERCVLDVHTLSAMTAGEAGLLRGSPGRLCVRYETDSGLRPITADRPLSLLIADVRGVAVRVVRALAVAIGIGGALGLTAGCGSSTRTGGTMALGGRVLSSKPGEGDQEAERLQPPADSEREALERARDLERAKETGTEVSDENGSSSR